MDIPSKILSGRARRALLSLSAQVQVHDKIQIGNLDKTEGLTLLLESASLSRSTYVEDALHVFLECLSPQQLQLLEELGVNLVGAKPRLELLVKKELSDLMSARLRAGIPESKKKTSASRRYNLNIRFSEDGAWRQSSNLSPF